MQENGVLLNFLLWFILEKDFQAFIEVTSSYQFIICYVIN